MKKNFVILTDLGLLRACRVVQSATDRRLRLELLEELKPESALQKLTEQLTHEAGRFPKGTGANQVAGDFYVGERHNPALEQPQRLPRLLVRRVNVLLENGMVENCWLVASAPVRLRLLDELAPLVRAKIRETFPLDLTKAHPIELIEKLQPVVPRSAGKSRASHREFRAGQRAM